MPKNRKYIKIKTDGVVTAKPRTPIFSAKRFAPYITAAWCLSFLLLLAPLTYSQPVTKKIQSSEQTFINERAKIIGAFQEKTDALRIEIKAAETQKVALKEEVDRLSKQLNACDLWMLLFSLADFVGFFILLFFPLMVINHFIYLVIREKDFFERHRKPLVITFVMIELLFFAPFMTYAQSGAGNGTNPPKPVSFEQKLAQVSHLLNLTEAERMIYLLENTNEKWVELPVVEVVHTRLKPIQGKVFIGSPEHFFTLAGLYIHTRQNEKARGALKQLLNLNLSFSQIKAPRTSQIYFKVMAFYIDNHQLVEAAEAVEKLMKIYRRQHDIAALGKLSTFLESHNMSESASRAIKGAIQSANTGEQILFLVGRLIDSSRNAEVIALVNRAMDIIDNPNSLIALSRLLFQKKRKELSAKVLENARRTAQRLPEFLRIARAAREQGFLTIAVDAVERALIYDPASRAHTLAPPRILPDCLSLPLHPHITLPVYLGVP